MPVLDLTKQAAGQDAQDARKTLYRRFCAFWTASKGIVSPGFNRSAP